jgi:diphthamide synthase (EF-2-diphthine--ammonia ligase)
VHEVTLQPESSNEAYDAALAHALGEVRERQPAVRRVAFGDIFLQDVRQYREERIAALGFDGIFPLWGEPTDALAREVVECGIRAHLVCVDTHALSAAFAGRAYDAALLAELPGSIDPCGENGEFHTFVSDGPGFRAPVPYHVGEVVMRGDRFAYCDLVTPTSTERVPAIDSLAQSQRSRQR